jgi:hypothetical protein
MEGCETSSLPSCVSSGSVKAAGAAGAAGPVTSAACPGGGCAQRSYSSVLRPVTFTAGSRYEHKALGALFRDDGECFYVTQHNL